MMSNDEDHRRMQRLQNRAMRIILKARKRTPIDELLSRLKWLSVKQKLVMNSLLTVFKMKNEMLPQYHCHNFYQPETFTEETSEMRMIFDCQYIG
jgi:hypothetical protein